MGVHAHPTRAKIENIPIPEQQKDSKKCYPFLSRAESETWTRDPFITSEVLYHWANSASAVADATYFQVQISQIFSKIEHWGVKKCNISLKNY